MSICRLEFELDIAVNIKLDSDHRFLIGVCAADVANTTRVCVCAAIGGCNVCSALMDFRFRFWLTDQREGGCHCSAF